MSGVIYDATRVKVCQAFYQICAYGELEKEWVDELWSGIISHQELYKELIYYIEHHTFKDSLKVSGYSLSDLYVWQMNKYNLIQDTGKNSESCNKERMAMRAFHTMQKLLKNPAEYVKRLEDGKGMDLF